MGIQNSWCWILQVVTSILTYKRRVRNVSRSKFHNVLCQCQLCDEVQYLYLRTLKCNPGDLSYTGEILEKKTVLHFFEKPQILMTKNCSIHDTIHFRLPRQTQKLPGANFAKTRENFNDIRNLTKIGICNMLGFLSDNIFRLSWGFPIF